MPDVLDLPPRIVVGKNGAYWRDYGDHYSMAVVSTDNDPVEIVAIYNRQEADATAWDRGFAAGLRSRSEAGPDVAALDRLMALWQEPWSEPAYGEAQMLLSRLRALAADPDEETT